MARAGSSEATSTVSSARGTVEIGFIAARTRSRPPTDIPPSVPPARPVRRRMTPSGPRSISSWATEPRRAAVRKPSPISTPLIAWMPMSAPARRESSRRSQCTCEPRPGGSPVTTTSTTPPRVSPSLCAASISATIAADPSASKARTGSASRAATSSAVGSGASSETEAQPIATVWETSRMP